MANTIEQAAEAKGRSLSEEVRERLLNEGKFDWRSDIAALLDKVAAMALLIEISTGRRWSEDPATAYTLSLAISDLLKRYGADERAPRDFQHEHQLPTGRLVVNSGDPKSLAGAIEALVNQADMFSIDVRQLLERYQGGKSDER
ncbi:MAG: hypothetical protein J2P54_06245 [Bradyrhizobiaceae bacterium]|nr:hypothetical protein [Bradyrhizobiaceae bacterium]